MSLENKLTYLNGTKDAIKQAIIDKGVSVTEADTFRSYATKIGEIQSGGTETKYTGHADAEGLKAIGWTDEDIQYYQENGVNWNEEDDEYHKVPQENIDLYGVLNENNISTYKNLIVYLPKIEITKTDCSSMFNGCYSLVTIPLLDTSNVTNMYQMFQATSITTIPLLDTSNVTNMNSMFSNCSSLLTIPLLDTSNVTSMNYMFSNCSSLLTIPLLNVTNTKMMYNMFSGCKSLSIFPILITSKTNRIENIFYECYKLSFINYFDMNNASSIYTSNVFYGCFSLQHIKIDNLKLSIKLNFSALLSKESLLYMIQNAAATSAITITLHSNVYDKYIEDPDIVSALSAQPLITLSK